MAPLTPPLCVRPPSRPRAELICGILGAPSLSSTPAALATVAAPWLRNDGNGTETEGDNARARGAALLGIEAGEVA